MEIEEFGFFCVHQLQLGLTDGELKKRKKEKKCDKIQCIELEFLFVCYLILELHTSHNQYNRCRSLFNQIYESN